MRTKTSGKAGSSAKKIAYAKRAAAAQLSFWAACPASVGVACLGLHHLLAALVMFTIAAVPAYLAKQLWQHAGKANVGAKFEEETRRALAGVRAWHVIHDADLGIPGDADHVVLGRFGPVVVETKAGGGQVRVIRGKVHTACKGPRDTGRQIPGDPIAQVLRQADALSRLARQRAKAVICVPWMQNAPLTEQGVVICSARDLPRVVAAATGRLSEQQADALVDRIR